MFSDSVAVTSFQEQSALLFRSTLPEAAMFTFVLWCILFVLCWPVALLALLLYPIIWLLLLPFRMVGIAVDGVLKLIWAIVTFPARPLTPAG
jgi:hypothetical protein